MLTWYRSAWIVVSLKGGGSGISAGWGGLEHAGGVLWRSENDAGGWHRALLSLLSAQPCTQHLVAWWLRGASRAPLMLHALHAGQAGVGLLHH